MDARRIRADGFETEVFFAGAPGAGPIVAASHPAERLDGSTAGLLARMSRRRAVCLIPSPTPGAGPKDPSLEEIVEAIEAARRSLRIERWVFWGMSGGGWLAQIYALRHPAALSGVIVESACACFRRRLDDPDCILSPLHPAWSGTLRARGLLAEGLEKEPVSASTTEWITLDGVGEVFRRRGGAALLVSPVPVSSAMRKMMPVFWGFDSREWLGRIRVPMLVVTGRADPVVPVRHVRAVHEAVPDSIFREIEGAGHVPTNEQHPQVRIAVDEFLRRCQPAE